MQVLVQYMADSKIWVRGHSTTLKMVPFNRSHTSSYWHFIVIMALSCTVSEISKMLVENCSFFLPQMMVALSDGEKVWEYFYLFRHNTQMWHTSQNGVGCGNCTTKTVIEHFYHFNWLFFANFYLTAYYYPLLVTNSRYCFGCNMWVFPGSVPWSDRQMLWRTSS